MPVRNPASKLARIQVARKKFLVYMLLKGSGELRNSSKDKFFVI
jgi:hypothetical protein